ncbi:MAG: DNA repair protein [Coriobacteriales bacterium]|nr:DNA repair protein [Coriobacteriales bacterium]
MKETRDRHTSYLCIDLKSFYASVECVDRGLDPLTTDLVVADESRTDKTICLAVSPSLKAKGVRNRCRLFEIPASLRKSITIAPPRMARYIQKSAEIYGVYLRWISADDIHVYSIDEAFMDVTPYLGLYGCSGRELGERIRTDVTSTTGIPATCGLGTNLYLAKIALDITAKHSPNFFGELDEESYRETLWNHTPITDFWRVGSGTARRLAELGIHNMGQLALAPTEPIYRSFGVDAEILIDHAWGIEPVRISDIKGYRSQSHSLSNGQVLGNDYPFDDALLVAKEMADALTLQLVEQGLVARSLTLGVGYRATAEERAEAKAKRPEEDEHGTYWRYAFAHAHGSANFVAPTQSRAIIQRELIDLFGQVVSRERLVHRLSVSLNDVVAQDASGLQLDLFADPAAQEREQRRQRAVNAVREKFGKNSLLRAMDLLPQATARERNAQIGGHRSG